MQSFFRQLGALIYKNFLVSVARRPIGFLLSVYGIPLAILAFLLSIPSFFPNTNQNGVSTPAPVKNLPETVHKKLVIVRPTDLGQDVDRVIDTFTKGVNKDLIVIINDESSLTSTCLPNWRGSSDCHAAVLFKDSPLTQTAGGNNPNSKHSWQYIIRADPVHDNFNFDVTTRKSDQEDLYLPLQLSVNNAITNSTTTPETIIFTPDDQGTTDSKIFTKPAAIAARIYTFALFGCYFTIIYRLTTFITAERESGMSQLVDSMGGGTAIASRVLSWLITFNVAGLPCFMALGALYQRLLLPSSSVGTLIGWQILLGFAVNSSTVFAAAFFTKSRVSAVYVMAVFFLLAIITQGFSTDYHEPPGRAVVLVFSALFPSSNTIFFIQQLCLWELDGKNPILSQFPPEISSVYSKSYDVTQSTMLGFLVLHIILYPAAAILIEKLKHGIHYRKRSFSTNMNDSTSAGVVAQTLNLEKKFIPPLIKRICCCGRRKPVAAVNGVSLQAHKGQILCLVGPNGSGKTTTLHMIAGFISPSRGSVKLDATPSQIGTCPQRNVLWDDLTVQEHVYLWNRIKAGRDSTPDSDQLITACDLHIKRQSQARTLSGGQKRKLQLACMFVGDSSVCLIDECTSGLDPLSRRAIWEILLKQRTKRSIIFTTHFLDEVDVLADQIVILADGKVKSQGSAAQLKNLYGGGYKVIVPRSAANLNICHGYPQTIHQDRLIYSTPDSRSASDLISTFVAVGITDVAVTGPQFEDVFLEVVDSSKLEPTKSLMEDESSFVMTPGTIISFWAQVRVLLRKRLTVLKRFWWPYLWAIFLPILATTQFKSLLDDYKTPQCGDLQPVTQHPAPTIMSWNETCAKGALCDTVAVAPQSANASLFNMVQNGFQEVSNVDRNFYGSFPVVLDSRSAFLDYIGGNRLSSFGGVFAAPPPEVPAIAYRLYSFSYNQSGSMMINLWSQMSGGIEINSSQDFFDETRKGPDFGGVVYIFFYTLLQAVYPAVFVLYPAIEKSRKVRALEYANGVRRAPLWVAYGIFDLIPIIVTSIGIVGLTSLHLSWNGPITMLLLVLILYGLAATLLGYVISTFTRGPLQSFLATMGVSMLMYAVTGVAFGVASGRSESNESESGMTAIAFGLNLFLPIGNVFRSLLIGLNMMETGCKGGAPVSAGSMQGYGGPIFYLILQVMTLLLIIIWIEGGLPRIYRRKPQILDQDMELEDFDASGGGVGKEALRAGQAETDLLRALHLTKSFGTNKAVDNVTFGLPKGDVMALIGPNGAGKSTLVNLIQSELSPDQGHIFLCQEDGRMPSSRKNLGVCPQYDALDFMNTREHLSFYARVKGIKDVKENVNYIMAKLGLTPHAKTLATKLSGGNKRKLSLAIAVMGTPQVLVLDEPTSFMDALAKRSFWKIIQEIAMDRSVLLTTHSMEEADALATRTAIMSKRLLAIGTTQGLRAMYSNIYCVSLLLASAPTSSTEEMRRVGSWVAERIQGVQFERDMLGGQIRFTIPASNAEGECPVASLIELLEHGKATMGIDYYSISGPTLENVFLSVVREHNVAEEDGVDVVKARRLWRRILNKR